MKAYGSRFFTKLVPAIAIVLFMVASSFVTMAAKASDVPPSIWTSKEEYVPGEVVVVNGQGFLPGPVSITLSHPEFTITDTAVVGSNGEFTYEGYTASWVNDASVPVTVTAYQDATHQATTQFYDPEATVQCWSLIPQQKWQKGDIKGYNEGDSIPSEVTLQNPGVDVTVTIGLDFIDTDPSPVYGLDYLTQYNIEPPVPPFNTWPNSSTPFSVAPSEGTILSQSRLANEVEPGQIIQVWQFTIHFATGASLANVKFGSHLAVTTHTRLGASFYPGSSLHIDIVSLDPSFDKGNRDVPIPTRIILTPPAMTLEKECLKELVVEGDTISFLLHYTNTGEADAIDVVLNDTMPNVLAYVSGSAMTWSTDNPTHVAFPPLVISPQMLSWDIGTVRGTGSGASDPVFEGWIQFSATVISDTSGEYTNHAFLNYTDDHGGEFPMVEASCSFMLGMLHVTLEKDCVDCAHVGDTIEYTYTVTNDGTIDIVDLDLTDDVVGTIVLDASLDAGDSATYTASYEVQPDDPDPLVNIATVTATDCSDHEVTDEASCSVDILHPEISVTKSADTDCAKAGEIVTYTIKVKNPSSDTDLTGVDVIDNVLGDIFTDVALDAGETLTKVISYEIPSDSADPLINVVTATGFDKCGLEVESTASWEIDILHPMITLTKEADTDCAGIGDVVTYTLTVGNPSSDTTMTFSVSDTMFGAAFWTGTLLPGTTETKVLTHLVTADDPDPLMNTATVTAMDKCDHVKTATASWSVDIVHPGIEITKEASLEVATVGDTILFYINVTNPSFDTPMDATVTDPVLGGVIFTGTIAPQETVEIVLGYLVTDETPLGPLTNTATVTATDECGHEASAEASVTVIIFELKILISKEANPKCGAVGDDITYTIVVTNPMDVPVDVLVTDTLLGVLFEGTIAAHGTLTVVTGYEIKVSDPDPLVNTATVEAELANGQVVSASATAYVDVVHPDIDITKTADTDCAHIGDVVEYKIIVFVPYLADVWMNGTVTDTALGFSETFTNLKPGDARTWIVDYTVTALTPDPFVNVAKVVAKDHQEHIETAQASWTVDILHPMIEVEKDCPQYAEVGQTITYSYLVTNPSLDTDLFDVKLVDDKVGEIDIGFLAADSSVVVTAPYLVTGDPDPLVNEVVASGNDGCGVTVSDRDSCSVTVLEPQILVEKECPEEASVGQEITYVITVTNLDNDDTVLYNVEVMDPLVGLDMVIPVLGLGESFVIEVPFVVPSIVGELVNEVSVVGYDILGFPATSEDVCHTFILGSVSGMKFLDTDLDGDFDDNEVGIANWVIYLNGTLDGGGSVARTTITDSLGFYQFTGLEAGVYTVEEQLLPGWVPTSPRSQTFTLTSGLILTFDFSNAPLGTISGYKFLDSDMDGVFDFEDLGLPGWTIELSWTVDDVPMLLTTTTDSNGHYEFTNLIPAVYTVSEVLKPGWTNTTPLSQVIDVSGAETFNVQNVNFGNVQSGCIHGMKWLDEYMNGYKDGYEPGLSGWEIILEGTTFGGAHVGPIITFTDQFGQYAFENLLPGVYQVREVLPDGWFNVTPSMREITVVAGSCVTCAKFGNVQFGCIEGWKFFDADMDGTKDGNEPGIPGWEITLTGFLNNGPFPWSDTGTPVGPITVLTDENGVWQFDHLLPGIYKVCEERRDGWTPTTPTCVSLWITSGLCVRDVKFGNVMLNCINGTKFNDLNGNGVWDQGEPGLGGWIIELRGVTMTGMVVTRETITDEFGNYEFCNLMPGRYTVMELLKDGWVNTTAMSVVVVLPTELDDDHGQIIVNFGNFQLGKITGSKWNDVNGDGILDNGDVPIEGWLIVLVGPHGTLITLTDEFGNFEFTGLGPGTYDVSEESVPGWVHTSASTETVSVLSGSSLSVPAFLNTQLGEICVLKYEDKNCNGVRDEGEPLVAIWPFALYMDDTLVATGVTDPDGFLCFEDLMPGDYLVVELPREGWTHTTPDEIPVELESGADVNLEFGNFHNVKIVVFKFDDIDGNGIYNPEIDRPLAGWNFSLNVGEGEFEVTIEKRTTDIGGIVVFEINCSGEYEVEEESRLNWVHTVPLSGEYHFEVVSGMEPLFLEFGNFKFGKILGQKIDDLNGNGVRDAGEPGLEGWTIWLAKEGIGPIAFTVTNETGFYEFGGLVPGEYTVYEILQPGWRSTNGVSHDVFVLGDSRNIIDFLNTGLACIFGSKYEDVNGDGIFEQGIDIPIEGWKITLEITTGIIHTPEGDISAIAIIGETFTDEDGQFEFCDLQPGLYIIVEETRDDWMNTTPKVQEVELTGEDIVLAPFLNARLGEICAFKFDDLNGNGRWDEGEPGIEGWFMELWMGGKLVREGLTCERGLVCFDDLMPGHYVVLESFRDGWVNTTPREVEVTLVSGQEVTVSFGNFRIVCIEIFKYEDVNGNGKFDNDDVPLAGWEFTITGPEFPNGLEVLTNEDGLIHICLTKAGAYTITEESPEGWVHVNPVSGMVTIDIKSGDRLPVIEFGNMRLGEIIITKFFDMDLDEIFDGDEVGLGGFVFWVNGTLNGGGFLNITGITGSDGMVEITGLPAGVYVVTEKLALSPPGYTPTTSLVQVVTIGSGSVASLEYGNAIVGKIRGEKFYDKDLDGILDGNEPGLAGWTIVLTGTTDNGNPVSRTTITDELGMYEFDDVVPGVYHITEILMDDWMHTTTLPVEIDLSGATVIDVVVNIGNIRLAEIHGYKFLDRYGNGPFGGPNGVFDPTESGLGNWQITLVGRTATGVHVSLSVLTDNDDNIGFYEFDDLMPGTYWLNETLLFGYMATTPISHMLIIPSHPLGPFVFAINFGNTIPAPDPEVQFQLHKGWNLWSMPIVVKGLTAKSLLAAIGSNGVVVSKLVPGHSGYTSYVAGVMPDSYDYPVVLGEGYYVWVKETTVFSLKGDLSLSSTKAVASGWNLVGYERMEETSASKLLASVTGAHATAITCLDGNTGVYKSYAVGFPSSYDFVVTPGRAYFIWVNGAGTLTY